MIQMNLHQIAAIVGGSLVGKEARIQGVTTDSRSDCNGRLFVALKGEQFDGHQFCQAAEEQGAAAVLVSSAVEVNIPQIICHDSLKSLQALASVWIKQTGAKVIGITGSNGKTTVKNMLLSVLGQKYQCMATQGNLNNEIGVPLTLLSIDKNIEIAVIEMGAAQIGDIKLLAEMAQPDVAMITNVSQAHVGRFGSEQNVAIGKGEIYQSLAQDGLAVINGDSEYAEQWQQLTNGSVKLFGETAGVDFQLVKANDRYFIKNGDQEQFEISLPVLGHHNYSNACAAAAIALSLGMEVEDVVNGLKEFKPEQGRLNLVKLADHFSVIDDSYNANPASVNAAIDVLVNQAKPTTLIVGDMAELGDQSQSLHAEIGRYAVNQGVDQILAVGEYAADICQGHESKCTSFKAMSELVTHLNTKKLSQGTILVKGSRSMKMERVVEMLIGGERL